MAFGGARQGQNKNIENNPMQSKNSGWIDFNSDKNRKV
jgi:hypothetical protein